MTTWHTTQTIAVAASLAVARTIWAYVRRQSRMVSPEFDRATSRASATLMRLASLVATKKVKHRWALYYALDRYARTLYSRHQYLTVPGRLSLDIDRCYIPLELRAGQTMEASRLLEKSGAVLLLGDPGSGKSALTSRLVRTMCERCIEEKERPVCAASPRCPAPAGPQRVCRPAVSPGLPGEPGVLRSGIRRSYEVFLP